ncbi:putative membrane protein [Halorhabdus sp. SVX81]|nr:putative membrane protein [Halorhabdus sp. SVX81]
MITIGLVSAVWPYEVARFEEQIDAIGSKRSWSDIEPADWKVSLLRISGIAVSLFGVLILFDI